MLLDSSWHIPYWREIERIQRNGAVVGAVIYDLLPAKFPESFTSAHIQHFFFFFNQAYKKVDFLMTISNSVLDDVQSYVPSDLSSSRHIPGAAFRLGQDFTSSIPMNDLDRDSLVRSRVRFGEDFGPFYLCVGTFSPRKNQSFVLDAFESLWAAGLPNAKLVYVGSEGWNSDALIHRMRSHPEWNRRLFWFHDLNDEELKSCYRGARGLVTASCGDGFNLPIVEALHNGCPVLASDIPVHREVGGKYASYFSLNDTSRLLGLLSQHLGEDSLHSVEQPTTFVWPNWHECCEEFLTGVNTLAGYRISGKHLARCA
ncbi:MAG: glycosyltransferase family 4 protein [Planctomycetaceae bacterium]|nr:glycosyltransferase family 4 protein [Planctomycetaceae bacterium]